jgi:3' terminal RNA ribose 2'-O-methyltransferase Hen1
VFLSVTAEAGPQLPDATALGFLLHKHPDRVHRFDLPVGTAHVFYPEAGPQRCTACLLLEVDPISLVRGKRSAPDGFTLGQYVNDRPYAASSLLAVAVGRVFGTALKGRCTARPDLVQAPLPLTVHLPALPSDGGSDLVRRLFAPLGWQVAAAVLPLDPPEWGGSRYVDLTLTGTRTLAAALSHLYVLLPVLDGAKHYWVGVDEVDKLIRTAGGWLAEHPERDLITRRYLAHQRSYVSDAVERLAALDDAPAPSPPEEDEAPRPLVHRRTAAVVAELTRAGARRVLDLGCGEGGLIRELLTDPAFTEILGVDVSARVLDRAQRRLGLDRLPDSQRARVALAQSSLTYRDMRLAGYDAAVLMEVVEHVDPARLDALERTVFGQAHPATVIVTTPNVEYNARYPALADTPGSLRHRDHRFEWTRDEFRAWADGVAAAHGYRVRCAPVGEVDPELGPPTQLAIFTATSGGRRTGTGSGTGVGDD